VKPTVSSPRLASLCATLEHVCVEAVESGHMTKDLAICIHGNHVKEGQYLYTEQFMDVLASMLRERLQADS
jgi:isocitrate dehydrogenase